VGNVIDGNLMNSKRTALEGLPTLEESTTSPFNDDERMGWVPPSAVEKLFEQFFKAMAGSFLSRGLPYIDRVDYDKTIRRPHIYIKLQVRFKEPTQATLEGVREELEVLAALLGQFFEQGVAISALLDGE